MARKYEELGQSEFDRNFYAASHFGVRALGLALVLLRVEGAENIPQQGGAIIASNHAHWSDTIFIPSAVPNRHVTVLGREGVMNPLFKRWGAISFHRPEEDENMSIETSRALEKVLKQDRLLHIFVPGTRKQGGRPEKIKRGAGYYSRRTGVPIVPTIIKGSEHLSDQRVTVRFVEPFPPSANNKMAELEVNDRLHQTIVENYDDIDLSVFRDY